MIEIIAFLYYESDIIMNLTFANKNPFSTFDFLGYFFPGALCVCLFCILTKGGEDGGGEREVIMPAIEYLKPLVSSNIGVGIFLFVLFSYIIGHLLSYISSITVELFYTWYYGYPTRYLLRKKSRRRKYQYLLNSHLGVWGMLGHLVVCILLLPIVVGHFFFERLLYMRAFIGRSLDDKLIKGISGKVSSICSHIGYKDARVTDADVHRVVMHYVYEHCQMHQVKFDNYVALYGLLRSVSFVFCLTFHYLLYRLLYSQTIARDSFLTGIFTCIMWGIIIFLIIMAVCFVITKSGWIKSGKWRLMVIKATDVFLGLFVCSMVIFIVMYIYMGQSYDSKNGEILQLVCVFFATYISYLGFAKFYRRFTLENFMALLICDIPKSGDNMISLRTEKPLSITIDRPTSVIAELIRAYVSKSK